MRICYYNPQTVLGVTLLQKLLRKSKTRGNAKYDPMLGYLYTKNVETAIVVDGTATSLTAGSSQTSFLLKNYFLMRIISFFEIYLWCALNRLNPFKTKIIYNIKELDVKEDVLFGFAFLTETFASKEMTKRSILKEFTGRKILHASHMFGNTKKIAENIKMAGVTQMAGESDLKKTEFYKKFFPFVEKVYLFPFVLRSRYRKLIGFHERKNICMAIGKSIILCKDINDTRSCKEDFRDYVNFYRTNMLQPMRQLIYDDKENLTGYIYSNIFFGTNKHFELVISMNDVKIIIIILFQKKHLQY